jgi:hypothetical protein
VPQPVLAFLLLVDTLMWRLCVALPYYSHRVSWQL